MLRTFINAKCTFVIAAQREPAFPVGLSEMNTREVAH